ncbi:MAG: hypothetical protein LUG83_10740 [Lachnospiraceae bacterium]|nr:hypothetical protein [Lachnospiraceae bacterium]
MEIVFETVVCSICAAPMIIIGIIQYLSKSPVGFYSGQEPPKKEQIRDIRAYNHRHGLMWILYGAGFIFCFIVGYLFGGEAPAILAGIECFAGLPIMMAYHHKLENKYLIK